MCGHPVNYGRCIQISEMKGQNVGHWNCLYPHWNFGGSEAILRAERAFGMSSKEKKGLQYAKVPSRDPWDGRRKWELKVQSGRTKTLAQRWMSYQDRHYGFSCLCLLAVSFCSKWFSTTPGDMSS